MTYCGLLLEIIACNTGCEYISDLHEARRLPMIRQVVLNISVDRFSAAAWNEAASYITGQTRTFKDGRSAREFLTSYCYTRSPGNKTDDV